MSETSEIKDKSLFAVSLQYKCPYKWRDMKGDNQTRHCTACKQNVYNISTMTRQEAVDLIREKEGNLCVRFYQRRDGTVITRDCVSILGKENIKTRWNIFACINAYFAFVATVLMPMLGPACVTIVQGVGPIMHSSTDRDTGSSLDTPTVPHMTPTPQGNDVSQGPVQQLADSIRRFVRGRK